LQFITLTGEGAASGLRPAQSADLAAGDEQVRAQIMPLRQTLGIPGERRQLPRGVPAGRIVFTMNAPAIRLTDVGGPRSG
jgi:hypothetical protein